MGRLRREVLSPVPSWRRPHALATLCLAALMFMSSLDALLLAYRLRCEAAWAERTHVEWNRGRGRAEVERMIAEQNAFLEALRRAEQAAMVQRVNPLRMPLDAATGYGARFSSAGGQ